MATQQREAGGMPGHQEPRCPETHGILQNIRSKDVQRRSAPSHLKWDEAAIAAHDKERGTRMKIEEPPTPYHRDHIDYKGVPAAALLESLEKIEVNAEGQALTSAEIEQKRKEEFERRRRMHYANEKKGIPETPSQNTSEDDE